MLEARCPYLIELKERLDLPAGLRGKANPKSSTGRIDVFTRVITDNSDRFDEVAPGYPGRCTWRWSHSPLPSGSERTSPSTSSACHRPAVAQRRRGPPDASRGADAVPDGCAGAGRRARPFQRPLPRARPAGRRAGPGGVQHAGQRAAARPDVGGEVDPMPFWDPCSGRTVTASSCRRSASTS